jgi:peptidyl-prolyl cis-trans isomerase D
MRQRARDDNFRVSNQQLEQFIREIPAFQDNGQFSFERYKQALQAQGMSQVMFEERLRQDLALQPLQEPYSEGGIVARAYVQRVLDVAEERREVELAVVEVEPFLAQVKVDDAEVKAFYDGNQARFQTPELAKVEYLILGLDGLAAQTAVDAAEVKQQYEQNIRQYSQGEQRQASHILVTVPAGATASEKAAAKKRAEELLEQAKKAPEKFADLAKQHSQDPGSKDQGGDLGLFGRGSMVKAFDDAVFAMKVGEIAGPVETDFGYHVIRLTDAKGEGALPLEKVRPQIEQELKRQKAGKRFAELAEQLQNLVYEQADSLAGAEKALNEKGAGVKVERTDWVGAQQALALARNNQKFVQALFSPESVQGKRNTEAIEIAPNTLIAGRIVEHKPAAPRPFDEVKADIVRQLQLRKASELAQAAGKEKLATLQKGGDAGLKFVGPQLLRRGQRVPAMSEEAAREVFRVDVARLPSYVGAGNERGGYTLVKVTKAVRPEAADEARLKSTSAQVEERLGREQFAGFLAALRQASEVKVSAKGSEAKK